MLASALGISRQAAHARLRQMVVTGELVAAGRGRSAHYRLPGQRFRRRYSIAGLEEDRVHQELVARLPGLAALLPDAAALVQYAFTEMLNNAIDHSNSKNVDVEVSI